MPNSIERLLQSAHLHEQAGRTQEAESAYRQALQRDRRNANAFYHLGLIARQTGRTGVALDLFQKGAAANPDSTLLLRALALSLQDVRRFAEAAENWRRITQLEPTHAEAHAQLGALLILLGRLPEAVDSLQRAAELDPTSSGLATNLGSALALCNRYEEAVVAQRRAVELAPDAPEPHHNLATSLRQIGLLEESIQQYREAIRLRPNYRVAGSGLLLNLQYRQHDRMQVFAEHREWAKRIAGSVQRIRSHPNDPSPERPLRIGYVSADFRTHSVGFFIEPLIAAHHADAVEVFCYSGAPQADAMTERIQRQARAWREIRHVSEHDLAQMIGRDQIDILIDLAGHTAGERLLAFAAKPAPIQVTYLGYPDTTGLSAMDYRITDPRADPPGEADAFHVEKLIRLERTAWCYRPPEDAPAVAPPLFIASDRITFGCCNALPKLSPKILALWAEILAGVPGSRLLIKTGGLQDSAARGRLLGFFIDRGIDASRLEFQGHTASVADHLASYGRVDIALDSYPYHGTTTTCDALWMGVPVITLAGDRHVSRVGVSLLNAIGHADLVAQTPEQYVEIAGALAKDRDRLSALRQNLRQQMNNSPLTDADSLARDIESAFRAIWREWCRQRNAS